MSLIADALRKAGSGSSQPQGSPPPPTSRPPWTVGALLVIGVIFALSFLFKQGPRPTSPSLAPPLRPKPAFTPNMEGLRLLRTADSQWRLSGIIRGGDGKAIALINGEVVEEGSLVQGARVARIDRNEVELETEGQTRVLKLQ